MCQSTFTLLLLFCQEGWLFIPWFSQIHCTVIVWKFVEHLFRIKCWQGTQQKLLYNVTYEKGCRNTLECFEIGTVLCFSSWLPRKKYCWLQQDNVPRYEIHHLKQWQADTELQLYQCGHYAQLKMPLEFIALDRNKIPVLHMAIVELAWTPEEDSLY